MKPYLSLEYQGQGKVFIVVIHRTEKNGGDKFLTVHRID